MEDEHESSSLKVRHRKSSSISLSCCFNPHGGRRDAGGDSFYNHDFSSYTSASASPIASPRRSPSAWLRSKAPEFPEIKDKCKNLFSRRINRHRRHASADFAYDPLSYALNFEDDDSTADADDLPLRSFTSRLPISPPRASSSTKLAAASNMPKRNDGYHDRVLPASSKGANAAVMEMRKSFELLTASASRNKSGGKSLEFPIQRKTSLASGDGTDAPAAADHETSGAKGMISRSLDEDLMTMTPPPPGFKRRNLSMERVLAVSEVKRSLELEEADTDGAGKAKPPTSVRVSRPSREIMVQL